MVFVFFFSNSGKNLSKVVYRNLGQSKIKFLSALEVSENIVVFCLVTCNFTCYASIVVYVAEQNFVSFILVFI